MEIGDRVRIKSWEQMVKEYGLDDDGNAKTEPYCFAKGMKSLCGKEADILNVWADGRILANCSDSSEYLGWAFAEQMVEPVKTIVISQVGNTTTCNFNGKTVSVKRYYKEDDSFETAVKEVIKKIFAVPHLEYNEDYYGTIGELTDLTLAFGEHLYVGDIVELYDFKNKTNLENYKPVCKEDGEYFIMGSKGEKYINGISEDFQIRKVKSFKDLKDGEVIGAVKAIK